MSIIASSADARSAGELKVVMRPLLFVALDQRSQRRTPALPVLFRPQGSVPPVGIVALQLTVVVLVPVDEVPVPVDEEPPVAAPPVAASPVPVLPPVPRFVLPPLPEVVTPAVPRPPCPWARVSCRSVFDGAIMPPPAAAGARRSGFLRRPWPRIQKSRWILTILGQASAKPISSAISTLLQLHASIVGMS
jgi:hypothetical protein